MSKQEVGQQKHRTEAQRKIWATCTAANLLISEISAYMLGQVVPASWGTFYAWATGKAEQAQSHSRDAEDLDNETPTVAGAFLNSAIAEAPHIRHDPETLATGHRSFLAALSHRLLLTDATFVKELRALMTSIDQIITSFVRLQQLRNIIDAEEADDSHMPRGEEQEIDLQLDRARKRTDSAMRSVTARLRATDEERLGSDFESRLALDDNSEFVPWKAGNLNMLLMKLDFDRPEDDSMRTRP